MTATQSLKLYEVLHKHFKNDADAKIIVEEIESVIDAKIENKKDTLATKEDLYKFQIEVEKRLNGLVFWIVGTGITMVGLIFTVIKLFIVK